MSMKPVNHYTRPSSDDSHHTLAEEAREGVVEPLWSCKVYYQHVNKDETWIEIDIIDNIICRPLHLYQHNISTITPLRIIFVQQHNKIILVQQHNNKLTT